MELVSIEQINSYHIQELLFLLNSDKGEEWAISNFKLKLIKYYRSMEAWKEATDKLE